MDTKPKIRVVDVPIGATADETELILNAPVNDGWYYLSKLDTNLMALPSGTGARAYYKLFTTEPKARDKAVDSV